MRIADMHWRQVEDWLKQDDRCVLPVGSTEQHALLSLCVDNILAERVAFEAAAPTGVPVFPPVNYGLAAYFMAYPGTITLQPETYVALLGDILASLAGHGFRRVLIVNGHGGNAPASEQVLTLARERHRMQVIWHNWWNAPATRAATIAVDADNKAIFQQDGAIHNRSRVHAVDHVSMGQCQAHDWYSNMEGFGCWTCDSTWCV